MARNRSTALIAIGAAVFVVGAALAFLAVRDDDKSEVQATAPKNASSSSATPVAAGSAAAATTVPAFKVPAGKEAVAVQVPGVPGLAGYAKVGDRVNLYGTFKDRQPNVAVKGVPLAKLAITNVEVLAVTGPAPGAESTAATYVLAVNPGDAEQIIYLASFEGIWMTLQPAGAPALGPTPGHNATNAA